MKIPLLLGISLLATAAGKAQKPQAEKPPEAPAAGTQTTPPGQTPSAAPEDTAHPDRSRRTMEHLIENGDIIVCPAPTPELEAYMNARGEEAMRKHWWQTIRMAKHKAAYQNSLRLDKERRELMSRIQRSHLAGEKPELRPRMDGIPYFLVAVPIKPAG